MDNNNLKILFVYKFCSLGGVETTIFNRVKALRRMGIDAHVLYLRDAGGYYSFKQFSFVHINGNESWIINFIKQSNFTIIDIIDTPWFHDTLRKIDYQGKLLVESHASDCAFLDYLYGIKQDVIAAIIVPSSYNKEIVTRRVGPNYPIYVVHNAIDNDTIHYYDEPWQWEGPRPELAAGQKMVCWIGRLEQSKRPYDFVDIAQLVIREHDDVSFWLVGGEAMSTQRNAVLTEIRQRGLRDRINWLPYVLYHDMPKLYSIASQSGGCLISTSVESFSMVTLEAMACRCPVIAVNGGGMGEIITDRVSGMLFKLGDVKDGAARIIDLIDQTEIRAQIIESAAQLIRDNYATDKIAADYLAVIQQTIEN